MLMRLVCRAPGSPMRFQCLYRRKPLRQPIKREIDHRRGVEVNNWLRYQSAHDRDSERPAELRAGPSPNASGNPPSSAAMVVIMIGRKRSRHASIDRVLRRLAFVALGFQREVDHHDGVLLHDADQQDDADQRDHTQIDSG